MSSRKSNTSQALVPYKPSSSPKQKRFSFSSDQMNTFRQGQIQQRQAELRSINTGFVSTVGVQAGPVVRGALGLLRSRFDTSGITDEQHQDSVGLAISGFSQSQSQNQLTMGVGMDLFGRMLRNVGRLKQDNTVRQLANMSGNPYYKPFSPKTDPNGAVGAESSRLKVTVNRAQAPHYDPEANSISLMNPGQLDQTAHELQHARDHLHGDLDLHNTEHRLASELNAFSRQQQVSMETTGAPPTNFEGRTPTVMAETYHGKKGYSGTLTSSLAKVKSWQSTK